MRGAFRNSFSLLLIVSVNTCTPSAEVLSPFSFEEGEQGVRLFENDRAVFFYQKEPKSLIGGSDDEKGYGGLCVRIKQPEDLVFTSGDGPVIPNRLQIIAGSWMDFSGTYGTGADQNGVSIICHPDTPNYPAPWILRQKSSMQNIVFPGRERVEISMDHPTILKYRMIVHAGNVAYVDLAMLQSEYEESISE